MTLFLNLIRKLATGFVSTLAFFAAFAAAGDVVVAAGIAVTGAIVQFVLAMTAQNRPGIVDWTASLASLTVVVALTGATLAGETAAASQWSPASVSCTTLHCACEKALPI
jgi:intracellular septation protein A